MNRTVPLQWKGRNVHLQHLEVPDAPPGCPTAAEVWDLILSVQGDGNWYAVTQTRRRSRIMIKQLHDALRNRAWWAGYDSHILTLMPTSNDGICFKWQYGENIELLDEVLVLKAERRAKRRKQVAG